MNNSALTGSSRWIANLPVGPSFAVSMKDSKGYTGGIITPPFKMTSTPGCNLPNPVKASSLNVAVTGNAQCGQAIVSINNGTAPYTLEVVPLDDRQQKTMHFASSPFGITLDMSEGVEYFLAVYDSADRSAVMGPYNIGSSSDNSCLGAASTVTAGRFSTLYPGGTATPTSIASLPTSTHAGRRLATPAVIGLAVGVPVFTLILTALLLWLCYKRSQRLREINSAEKIEIDPPGGFYSSYTPAGTSYYLNSASHTNSHYDLPSINSSQHPPAPVPYPFPSPVSSDRQTIHTVGGTSASEQSTAVSDLRRHLTNPNPLGQASIVVEPFDPRALARPATAPSSQAWPPPLPPAYSAS